MVLTDREKHLINLAIVMKVKHFKSEIDKGYFPKQKLEAVIDEYKDILKLLGFEHTNRI